MTHAEITAAVRASLMLAPKKSDRAFEATSLAQASKKGKGSK